MNPLAIVRCVRRRLLAGGWVLGLVAMAAGLRADESVVNFAIPEGVAATTLKQFAEQSGREIMFVAQPVAPVPTHAVQGKLTVRQGLDLLLAGTPLRAIEDPRTGALVVQHRLDRSAPGTADADDEEELMVMHPFEVNVSPLGTVAVKFRFIGEDSNDYATGDFEPPIDLVTIMDVAVGSPGEKAGLRKWDELALLNGKPIRGLTVREFAALIHEERKRGDLRWQVSRGIARMTFYTVYNGTTRTEAELAASRLAARKRRESRGPADGKPALVVRREHARSAPAFRTFTVDGPLPATVEAKFILSGQNLLDDLEDPILEVQVSDVRSTSPDAGAGVLAGDRIIRLNGILLRGLTIRSFNKLVAAQKKRGDLVWEIQRGSLIFSRRMSEAWLNTPGPAG